MSPIASAWAWYGLEKRIREQELDALSYKKPHNSITFLIVSLSLFISKGKIEQELDS